MDKLEKGVIIDEVLPLLTDIKLNDVNILVTVIGKVFSIELKYKDVNVKVNSKQGNKKVDSFRWEGKMDIIF